MGVSLRADSRYKTVANVPDAKYKGVFYPTPERAVHALAKMVSCWRYIEETKTLSL